MKSTILGILLLGSWIALGDTGARLAPKCSATQELVSLVLCVDDEVRDLDELRARVQIQVLEKVKTRYSKAEPVKAKRIKEKILISDVNWKKYRDSYCDLESIYVTENDERGMYIQQCLVALTKSRIEELRVLQINI
jgi:uncharacterized protein YecT (DUF1311 family)